MILSARDLKVRGVICTLRFLRVVDFSMSMADAANAVYLPLSVTLTGVCDGCQWFAVVSDAYRCLRR